MIRGEIRDSYDSMTLPGVQIIEKGTSNETTSAIDGTFQLEVQKLPTTIVVSFVGFLTKEVAIGSDSPDPITLNPDILKHFFDSQIVGFYLNSGLINNPVGGKLKLSLPYINRLLISSEVGYQTNLDESNIWDIDVEASFFTNRYAGNNLHYDYTFLSLQNQYEINSLSTEFIVPYIPYFDVVGGYSWIRTRSEDVEYLSNGPTVGLKYTVKPIWLDIKYIISFFQSFTTHEVLIKRGFRRLRTFASYRSIAEYKELSIGVGFEMHYLTGFRKEQ